MKVDALRTCDKQELTSHLRKLYTLKFPWADDTLVHTLITNHITGICETVKEEDYLDQIS